MSKLEKIIEYKKLKNKKNKIWSEIHSLSDEYNNLSNDEIRKIPLIERAQYLNTTLKDVKTEVKKMLVIDDKMEKIRSSLNEDEKKEFEQLGLLNDDEKS